MAEPILVPNVRRPRGRVVLALAFAILGGGAWAQAVINLFSKEPRALGVRRIR